MSQNEITETINDNSDKQINNQSDNNQLIAQDEILSSEEEAQLELTKKEPAALNPKQKTVPHGAFHEERQERKKAQAKLSEIKEHLAELYKIKAQNRAQQIKDGKESAIETPPDPAQDPIGFMNFLAQEQRSLLEQEQQQYEQRSQELADEALENYWQENLSKAQETHPDFFKASNYLYEQRFAQLKALSNIYSDLADEEAIKAQIGAELRQFLEAAILKEQDPAELLYNLAKEMGYQTPATSDKDPHELEQKIVDFSQRAHSAKTLTANGGKNSADPYSLEAIDNMSEGEFALWIKKPENEVIFKNLMAGN